MVSSKWRTKFINFSFHGALLKRRQTRHVKPETFPFLLIRACIDCLIFTSFSRWRRHNAALQNVPNDIDSGLLTVLVMYFSLILKPFPHFYVTSYIFSTEFWLLSLIIIMRYLLYTGNISGGIIANPDRAYHVGDVLSRWILPYSVELHKRNVAGLALSQQPCWLVRHCPHVPSVSSLRWIIQVASENPRRRSCNYGHAYVTT